MKTLPIVFVLGLSLVACGPETTTIEDPPIGGQSLEQIMPVNGRVEVPGHGEEKWFAYGAVAGNQWTPANGVVTSHVFEDGATIVTGQVNVEPAKEGTFYEVWIRDLETQQGVSAGHLVNHFGDARHGFKLESSEDLRRYLDVRVTLEKDDGNTEASTHIVATATLKPTKRR
ncbi:anti-sigma factor [Candidatus Peribacteria bacterium]|nr:anti-sigma factor [Candidatus Peribacteria bacterium]